MFYERVDEREFFNRDMIKVNWKWMYETFY